MSVVRVMLSIPEEFLELVDKEAKKNFQSRSEFVRDALRSRLDKALLKMMGHEDE